MWAWLMPRYSIQYSLGVSGTFESLAPRIGPAFDVASLCFLKVGQTPESMQSWSTGTVSCHFGAAFSACWPAF
jgi:hypothetical protein